MKWSAAALIAAALAATADAQLTTLTDKDCKGDNCIRPFTTDRPSTRSAEVRTACRSSTYTQTVYTFDNTVTVYAKYTAPARIKGRLAAPEPTPPAAGLDKRAMTTLTSTAPVTDLPVWAQTSCAPTVTVFHDGVKSVIGDWARFSSACDCVGFTVKPLEVVTSAATTAFTTTVTEINVYAKYGGSYYPVGTVDSTIVAGASPTPAPELFRVRNGNNRLQILEGDNWRFVVADLAASGGRKKVLYKRPADITTESYIICTSIGADGLLTCKAESDNAYAFFFAYATTGTPFPWPVVVKNNGGGSAPPDYLFPMYAWSPAPADPPTPLGT
jgi:hypothetical protein